MSDEDQKAARFSRFHRATDNFLAFHREQTAAFSLLEDLISTNLMHFEHFKQENAVYITEMLSEYMPVFRLVLRDMELQNEILVAEMLDAQDLFQKG